tara:strand:+ start:222 stop:1478 length:1257 start_codon:yes stop_codon:yes gene_type:complete
MTFNWPDVPFSGTEVDAFVVAYKAFAQEVLDAYNTSDHIYGESNGVEYLNLPYMTKENVKIYLEKALVYSSFVIKQRAGESGPGTDFELGNSPLDVELPPGEAESLLKKMGCTWDNDSFDICFENGDNDNPDDKKLDPSDPPPEVTDVADGAEGDDDGPDDDDCPITLSNYRGGGPNATNNGQSPDKSQLWQAYVGMLKTLGLGLLATGRGSLWTAGDMLGRYLSGVGGIYTGTGFVKPTLGVEINAYMNQNTSRVTERTPTAAEISGYGMGANDKIFDVDFYGYLWLGSAFGGAIVVAEGTTGNITYVKQVIDDYDFEYAYKIARSNGLPGLDLASDDSIISGPRLCQENIQRTVCGALTAAGPNHPSFSGLQYATRLPVAEAHGDGCVPFQEDRSSITGKPFPVRIQFSRASGNGL